MVALSRIMLFSVTPVIQRRPFVRMGDALGRREGKQFDQIPVGITEKKLLHTIAAWTRPTGKFNAQPMQLLNNCLKVFHLERQMGGVATRKLIWPITWNHLRGATRLRLANQVQFGAAPTQPGARKIEGRWARDLLHLQRLCIEPARPLHIGDEQRGVIERTNDHDLSPENVS